MTGFHTCHCGCERVGRDSGCGHEESHVMHVTPHPKRVYGTCNSRVAYVHQGLL